MNFRQSSYDIREDDGMVMMELTMSRTSSQQFAVIIILMDITTVGTYICAYWVYCVWAPAYYPVMLLIKYSQN